MLVFEYITENERLIPNMDCMVIKGKDLNVTYSTSKYGRDLLCKRFGAKEVKDIRITLSKEIYIEVV